MSVESEKRHFWKNWNEWNSNPGDQMIVVLHQGEPCKGLSLTSNAGRDDMIFDPPKFQIPKI